MLATGQGLCKAPRRARPDALGGTISSSLVYEKLACFQNQLLKHPWWGRGLG